ncbi:MAG: DUF721 domain-containing protein [Thiotrichales bacterium]|nr:DUF721 domain-containing protein [Thiotrichales bacterium]
MTQHSSTTQAWPNVKPLLSQTQGTLKNLLESAQFFQLLLETARDPLPNLLQTHLIGVAFEQQTLLLQIDHALFATQLRFYEPSILGAFQTHFPHLQLNRVKVRVQALEEKPRSKRSVSSYPSSEDAEAMQQLSQEVESEALRQALLRLSQRAQSQFESEEES